MRIHIGLKRLLAACHFSNIAPGIRSGNALERFLPPMRQHQSIAIGSARSNKGPPVLMPAQPSIQDVAEALAITTERESRDGALWCPPHDGAVVRRWVTDRGSGLGGGIRRLVRLVRLMAAAGCGDYGRLLYLRMPALRAAHFRRELSAAAAQWQSIATASETGVVFTEPALAVLRGGSAGFAIDFSQMPRLAALLDVLHNSLGFAAVLDLLQPVCASGAPTSHADEVARALHAALNAWLSLRLGSANHDRQARQIRSFLAARGPITPDAIDDEAILRFWSAVSGSAGGDGAEGFRLYRSAASAVLRYRQALIDAAAARQLEASFGQDFEGEPADGALEPHIGEPWQSPLQLLAAPVSGRIKWLTKKEQASLGNYLGTPAPDQEDADVPAPWKAGLAGDHAPFDLAFWLTLLRVDLFGAAQASLVARLRKHATAGAAIAEAMAPIGSTTYMACAADYGSIAGQLRLECLAALAILMEAGAPEALLLLRHFGGVAAVADVLGPLAASPGNGDADELSAELGEAIAAALQSAMTAERDGPYGATRGLLLAARAAVGDVNRTGFRRQDRSDAGMLAGLRSGAVAIVELLRELDRLTERLALNATSADLQADAARFRATFEHIYCAAPVA
jgi:hypothetical protein